MGRGHTGPSRKAAAAELGAARDAKFLAFCKSFTSSRGLLILARSADPGYRSELYSFLCNEIALGNIKLGNKPIAEFIGLCSGRLKAQLPAELRAALKQRSQEAESNRVEKRILIEKMGLRQGSNESRLAALEASATSHFLQKLADPDCYPPRGFFICETKKSRQGWTKWVYERKLPDSRLVSKSSPGVIALLTGCRSAARCFRRPDES